MISQGAYVAPIHAPWAVKPLALALSLLTVATAMGAAIVGRAEFGGSPDRVSREYAALLPAMFLVAPIAWASFALVLIPALIHAAKVRLDGDETFPWSVALAALLIALPVDPVAMSAVLGVQATMWACSTTFLGVAILYACTTRDLLRC